MVTDLETARQQLANGAKLHRWEWLNAEGGAAPFKADRAYLRLTFQVGTGLRSAHVGVADLQGIADLLPRRLRP